MGRGGAQGVTQRASISASYHCGQAVTRSTDAREPDLTHKAEGAGKGGRIIRHVMKPAAGPAGALGVALESAGREVA